MWTSEANIYSDKLKKKNFEEKRKTRKRKESKTYRNPWRCWTINYCLWKKVIKYSWRRENPERSCNEKLSVCVCLCINLLLFPLKSILSSSQFIWIHPHIYFCVWMVKQWWRQKMENLWAFFGYVDKVGKLRIKTHYFRFKILNKKLKLIKVTFISGQ